VKIADDQELNAMISVIKTYRLTIEHNFRFVVELRYTIFSLADILVPIFRQRNPLFELKFCVT